jgi:hypothetical protein
LPAPPVQVVELEQGLELGATAGEPVVPSAVAVLIWPSTVKEDTPEKSKPVGSGIEQASLAGAEGGAQFAAEQVTPVPR